MIRLLVGVGAVIGFTAASPGFTPAPRREGIQEVRAPKEVRVALAAATHGMVVGGPRPWRLVDAWGRTHASGDRAGAWRIEREGRRLRASPVEGGRPTPWSDEPFTLVAGDSGGVVAWDATRYRGELRYVATDTAIVLVNVLPIEEYLRGVVPLEIGPRTGEERPAVEAQAIAARSFTVVRTLEGVTRPWDLTARATDQVYGGVNAESAQADAAVRATASLVLTWRGQIVRAPYHSTCGGHTAAPDEVFQGSVDSWLRAVSDRIPGTDRSWCDRSPRFSWERRVRPEDLARLLARTARGRGVTRVRDVESAGETRNGRSAGLRFHTDRGVLPLAGNELRFTLAGVGGEILPSTYFSARWSTTDGLTIVGRGNGHGVGMCQWGAIGRARAGMDAATILLAYYPGTSLARVR